MGESKCITRLVMTWLIYLYPVGSFWILQLAGCGFLNIHIFLQVLIYYGYLPTLQSLYVGTPRSGWIQVNPGSKHGYQAYREI